jgi:hypothetical protein
MITATLIMLEPDQLINVWPPYELIVEHKVSVNTVQRNGSEGISVLRRYSFMLCRRFWTFFS